MAGYETTDRSKQAVMTACAEYAVTVERKYKEGKLSVIETLCFSYLQ